MPQGRRRIGGLGRLGDGLRRAFAKPLDTGLILQLADTHEALIAIEEGSIGGFGSHVAQLLLDNGRLDGGLKMRSMVLPDAFSDHDEPAAMYARAKLDADEIVAKVFETLNREPGRRRERALSVLACAQSAEPHAAPRPARQTARLLRRRRAGDRHRRARPREATKPVYVRHEIVHNKRVVDTLLARRAAKFVEELSEVPDGAVAVFSAHGVPKRIEAEAAARGFVVHDATCPLVTKVHNQAKRYVAQGRKVMLIGHAGHPEVEGTLGQVAAPITLVQNEEEVEPRHPGGYARWLHHADDAQRRRHEGDHRGASPAIHRHRRP